MKTPPPAEPPTDRPTKVKVLNLYYRIRWVDNEIGDGANKYGWVNHQRNLICIDRERPAAEVVDTLVHELLHVCWRTMALPPEATEESVCGRLASALCTVWIDNPDLFAWINQELADAAAEK